jgi:hypothetical protein
LKRAPTHRPSLEVLEDRSVPAFLATVDYTVGGSLHDVVAADFNNDTVPDLAVVNTDNSTVSVLLGNGDGTFDAPRTSATGSYPLSLAVGDLDGDGNLDVATANSNDVSVLLGDGTGSFTPASGSGIFVGASPQSVAMGDFNGDGLLDLGVTSYEYMAGQYASVLLGNGDGSFSGGAYAYLGGGRYGYSAAVTTNLNGDGFDDFVTVTNIGNISVHALLSDSSGHLHPGSTYVTSYGPPSWDAFYYHPVAAGDLDADGDTDLVISMVGVLLGDGTGSFSAGGNYGSGAGGAVLGDFTGDGNIDIAMAPVYPGGVTILRGQGNGAFSAAESFAANSGPYAIVATDFNGDGWLDVATLHFGGVSVLINDRSWPFVPPTVSINDAVVTEGNTGTVNATFTVALSYASNVDVTVQYATADLTAAAGSDYKAASGTVIVPAGQTRATVTVAVRGDRLGEPDETFAVNLSAAANATIGDGQGIGTILDDEPRISISDFSMKEGKKNKTTLFTFTVTLSAAYDQPVTMSYRTLDGTAKTSDQDYVAKTGTLTFAPGETTKTITIEVKGDNKREANELFYVLLFGNSSNSWFAKDFSIGTILNDD